MVKEKNGMYKNILSFNHRDGSVLGSNVFQGRHLVFSTGYSSAAAFIGIAEAESCSADDNELDYYTASNSVTFSPTVLSYGDAEKEIFVTRSERFLSWPIYVGVISFLSIVIFALLCYRKKRKNPKQDETAVDEDIGSTSGESNTFVTYGLRSNIVSMISSFQNPQHNKSVSSVTEDPSAVTEDHICIGGDSNTYVSYGLRSCLRSVVSSNSSQRRLLPLQHHHHQGNNISDKDIGNTFKNMNHGPTRSTLAQDGTNTQTRYGQKNNTHDTTMQKPLFLAQSQSTQIPNENILIVPAEPIVSHHNNLSNSLDTKAIYPKTRP